jgi:hypothetical protein
MNQADDKSWNKRMDDFERKDWTSARTAVALFESSPIQIPDRDDVEIAASLTCGGDTSSFMKLFDEACALRELVAGENTNVRLEASFSKVRDFAADCLASNDLPKLERMVGGTISDACYRRIAASREDTQLSAHHLASAADHYAHDVISALSAMIGRPVDDIRILAAPDGHEEVIRDLPFLCFLCPSEMERTHA